MAQGRSTGVTFTQQVGKVKENLEEVLPLFMKKLSTEVVRLSPVFSGAYVNSHEIAGSRSGGGKFTTNLIKTRESSNPDGERVSALSNLFAQIEALPKEVVTVSLTNRVPHAYKVEYAGWASTPPYMVYSTTKSRASAFLQEAITEAGLK